MANDQDKKAKKEVPAYVKTSVAVAEFVARGLAAYIILNNFDHVVATFVGGYFVITASIIFVGVFHKAFKQ